MSLQTSFGQRVAGVFVTRIARFVAGVVTSFLLARILLPEGRGQYALLVLVPGMLVALGQFGTSSLSFFAGRGGSVAQLRAHALLLTTGLSVLLVGGTLVLLPWLTSSVLEPAPRDLLFVSLAAVPFQFLASMSGSVLIGRQRFRVYNVILIGQAVLMLALVVVLVLVLRLGVAGAVWAYVSTAVLASIAVTVELWRAVGEATEPGAPVSLPQILGYGMRIYPASVAGYFSYRADVLILSALLGDAAVIGLYAFAVSLAELTFFVPDAVSTVFYPRVAGMQREAADASAPQVARFTVLITILAVVVLIPVALVAILVIVPDYLGSMLPFLVILPGIVALSSAKVLAGYISGLGLPLSVAGATGASLVLNIVANLLLIPWLGIVGASLASVLSYTTQAVVLALIAARLSRRRAGDYLLPTGAEVRRLVDGVRELRGHLGRVRGGPTP
jgi:O-antigen/teichoic acid export membrane protein